MKALAVIWVLLSVSAHALESQVIEVRVRTDGALYVKLDDKNGSMIPATAAAARVMRTLTNGRYRCDIDSFRSGIMDDLQRDVHYVSSIYSIANCQSL